MSETTGQAAASAEPAGLAAPRRGFLDWFVGGSFGVLCLTYLSGIVAFLSPAKKSEDNASGPFDAGPLDDLPVGQSKVVERHGSATLIVRTEEGVLAFSAVCTHLGCIVQWDTARSQVHCPCHAAVFDTRGNVVSGPPPTPLPVYPVEVRDGHIIVGAT